MSITVVGSIAFDTVETPSGTRERLVGGAATHFALAASLFERVRVVGRVGQDFGPDDFALLEARGTSTGDVQLVPGGKTFFWRGKYGRDLNSRRTLDTQLNVFSSFRPELSLPARTNEFLFLANIQPELQLDVLNQCVDPAFVALDSMDFWIETSHAALLAVIERVDCVILNDSELRQLTAQSSVYAAARELLKIGPRIVVAKRGEYGAVMVTEESHFGLPAYPLQHVVDPTGAGDTFAGGFLGYLARHAASEVSDDELRRATAYGTALASFNVEGFGTERVRDLSSHDVEKRVRDLHSFTRFEHAPVAAP